jgi:predicted dithiol-disulfide oxidoreductase (DUF899 family)
MGWKMPWYTMLNDFDVDFGIDEWHGTNAFIRDGNKVFRTYLINARGDEALGEHSSCLDMNALGRQEEWEDSPEGYPQTPPYECWIWHDEPHKINTNSRGSFGVHTSVATAADASLSGRVRC